MEIFLFQRMDHGHVMRAFYKNIPNNSSIWADGPNKLWGAVKLGNIKLVFITKFFHQCQNFTIQSILLLSKWRTKSCLVLPSDLLLIVYYSEITLYM